MLKLGRYRATLKDSISILSLTYNMVDIWDRVPGTVSQSWTWKYIRRFTYLLTHYFIIFEVQLLLKGYFVFVQRCSTSKSCFDFQCQLIILLNQLFEQKKTFIRYAKLSRRQRRWRKYEKPWNKSQSELSFPRSYLKQF